MPCQIDQPATTYAKSLPQAKTLSLAELSALRSLLTRGYPTHGRKEETASRHLLFVSSELYFDLALFSRHPDLGHHTKSD